jgi:hypothetical protein
MCGFILRVVKRERRIHRINYKTDASLNQTVIISATQRRKIIILETSNFEISSIYNNGRNEVLFSQRNVMFFSQRKLGAQVMYNHKHFYLYHYIESISNGSKMFQRYLSLWKINMLFFLLSLNKQQPKPYLSLPPLS